MLRHLSSSGTKCPTDECAKWAYKYLNYCLCSPSDWASMSLGLISVFTWTVAEIPQIITNYKQKSTEGLSIAFLATWIIGDICNVAGCLMEPATLPTQYYTAALYTTITSLLVLQALYYDYLYPKLRRRRQQQQDTNSNHSEVDEKDGQISGGVNVGQLHYIDFSNKDDPNVAFDFSNAPVNIPSSRDLYFTSARSLNKSSTPPLGSFLAQRMASSTSRQARISTLEPLLASQVETETETETEPESTRNVKPLLSVVSTLTLVGTMNLCFSSSNRSPNPGFVIPAGRKLLQVRGGMLREPGTGNSNRIASFLGWVMAVIYMGGRIPQIFLNMRKGNVEGLNPLMFLFALIGNATYVASILANSLEWSDLRPNLPWLVDAAGCVMLDAFILLQFFYLRRRKPKADEVHEDTEHSYVV